MTGFRITAIAALALGLLTACGSDTAPPPLPPALDVTATLTFSGVDVATALNGQEISDLSGAAGPGEGTALSPGTTLTADVGNMLVEGDNVITLTLSPRQGMRPAADLRIEAVARSSGAEFVLFDYSYGDPYGGVPSADERPLLDGEEAVVERHFTISARMVQDMVRDTDAAAE